MKTKEFIKKVEELGYQPKIVRDKNGNPNEITIFKDDVSIVIVWPKVRYAIKTIMDDGFIPSLACNNLEELYELCFEYANTPVKDRKEEKKFLIQHKYLVSKNLLPVNLVWNKLKDVYRSINLKVDNHIYQAQFTFREYEEIKKKLNTDLADFELVEVEE